MIKIKIEIKIVLTVKLKKRKKSLVEAYVKEIALGRMDAVKLQILVK